MKQYAGLLDNALEYALKHEGKNKVEIAMDKLAVNFGTEISKIGQNSSLQLSCQSI
jgi:hypothetical protein